MQVPHPLADGSRVWVTQYQYLTPKGTLSTSKTLRLTCRSRPEDATTDVQLRQPSILCLAWSGHSN